MKGGAVILGSPNVPIVPYDNFSKLPVKQLAEVWPIIGPSVARNIENLPLWQVIAAAYCEGLNHGHAIGLEKKSSTA